VENKPSKVIKRSSEFLLLREAGRRHWATKWLLLNYKKNSLGSLRFGTTASRKVGSAVIRNKLKRWVREYFRSSLMTTGIPVEIDINIIFKPMDSEFYKNLTHEDFLGALDRGFKHVRKDA
jgi:ribonuclease P protein component